LRKEDQAELLLIFFLIQLFAEQKRSKIRKDENRWEESRRQILQFLWDSVSGWYKRCLDWQKEQGTREQAANGNDFTLIEAPANRASCLMCAPFFPMMAPTAWVGMKRFTISCSGYWNIKIRH
jgi:valyl-tRNA synthetase